MVDQYYNMKEKIVPMFHIIELARKAMAECGVELDILFLYVHIWQKNEHIELLLLKFGQ